MILNPAAAYVVLHHAGIAEPHFDLMIQVRLGEKLSTWRLAAWPVTQELKATRLPDHRVDFLDYEGPLTGDRGFVKRVQHGCFLVEQNFDLAHPASVVEWLLSDANFRLRLVATSPNQPIWTITPDISRR